MTKERAPKGATSRVICMMTEDEKQLCKDYAAAIGITLSSYVSALAIENAQKEIATVEAYRRVKAAKAELEALKAPDKP
jgi:uncharacterized protein (DUF1778 family)